LIVTVKYAIYSLPPLLAGIGIGDLALMFTAYCPGGKLDDVFCKDLE